MGWGGEERQVRISAVAAEERFADSSAVLVSMGISSH